MFPFETIFFGMIFKSDGLHAIPPLKVIYDDIASNGNTSRRNDKHSYLVILRPSHSFGRKSFIFIFMLSKITLRRRTMRTHANNQNTLISFEWKQVLSVPKRSDILGVSIWKSLRLDFYNETLR